MEENSGGQLWKGIDRQPQEENNEGTQDSGDSYWTVTDKDPQSGVCGECVPA